MHKSKPVVIFLAIQLVIAISLALINPITDFIIRQKGTEYTFSVEEAWFTGDFTSYVEANCFLDFRFDFDRFDYHPENYAVIETDENGISYISRLSETPPESGDWIGTEEKPFDYWGYYSSDEIDYSLIEKNFGNSVLSDDFDFFKRHNITVKVSVYNGKTAFYAFLVDGVEIEKYLENL